MTVDITSLKKVKNSVIGNPMAKVQLVQDVNFIKSLIDCLNPPGPTSNHELRIEAAHVIASLSYGSPTACITLLRLDAPRAFLFAITNFSRTDPAALRTAFLRGLRAISVSIAEIVGPSLWGLKPENHDIREEAKEALEYLLQLDSLDVYLPLLNEGTAVPLMLASILRTPEYRSVVGEWVPLEVRQKEVKTRRGWEKTGLGGPLAKQGGWVARGLTALLGSRDAKVQEAALSALAALTKDNPPVASALSKAPNDKDASPLSSVITLIRSRYIDVQLAACLCATHITRARQPTPTPEDPTIRIILSTLTHFLAPHSTDTAPNKTKAAFILYHLVSDDPKLCELAHARGCVTSLGKMLKDLVSLPPPSSTAKNGRKEAKQEEEETEEGGEDEEPESTSQLREAVLTTLAALSLFSDSIRRALVDDLGLLPYLLAVLKKTKRDSATTKHVGTRYAACQCVRALSRAVSVLRTGIVDSGLGMVVFSVFMDEKGEEDRRVVGAALAGVCNIVNEFSPLKPIYLEQGLVRRLVAVLQMGDLTLRVSALWAVKNLVRKTSTETKRDVMSQLGWKFLTEILMDPDESIQEQAFSIVRNLTESEDGIEMVFREIGPSLLDAITATLGSSSDDVMLQAANTLGNLSNTPTPTSQSLILTHPLLLTSLRTALAEARSEIKKPLVTAVLELVKADPRGRRGVFVDAGVVSTLRRLCEWTGAGLGGGGTSPSSPGGGGRRNSNASSPTAATPTAGPGGGVYGSWGGMGATYFGHPVYYHSGGGGGGGQHHGGGGHFGFGGGGLDDDKEVVERARVALDWLEHGDVYVSSGVGS